MDAPLPVSPRSDDRAARADEREAELIHMFGELARLVPSTDALLRVMAPDVEGHAVSAEAEPAPGAASL